MRIRFSKFETYHCEGKKLTVDIEGLGESYVQLIYASEFLWITKKARYIVLTVKYDEDGSRCRDCERFSIIIFEVWNG